MASEPVELPVNGLVGLPVVGLPPTERADAARNRRKILDAAAHIVATAGVDGLSMEEVAQRAGVGIGTVYRRFGDRAGLAYALLDERERELQTAFLSGPPPLGPGAEPVERIKAFLHALHDRVEAQPDLLVVAEMNSTHARFTGGAYAVHHTHLVTLLNQARPGCDAHYLADALLAPLAASTITYQRLRGMSAERIKSGLDELLEGITKPST
ncbi:TetR/AcrR family transcriptional regulator [Actinokineospora cianjurensis]|uniref:TetR family transcriptional regulator n=1 Tax=Actinokineospora cianjurensis TaxID=585224 RepID=A0A421AYS9_9PSEU|nr:TetR/AcrR family transcriptional regulator [Actinokineospora cianjurensis]RLK54980.1 TetR family transcriptional regulator [Actinokineospora cianjurensis]